MHLGPIVLKALDSGLESFRFVPRSWHMAFVINSKTIYSEWPQVVLVLLELWFYPGSGEL